MRTTDTNSNAPSWETRKTKGARAMRGARQEHEDEKVRDERITAEGVERGR